MKNFAKLFMFVTFLLQTLILTAQSFPVESIMVNGSPSDKVNFLFLGDGYTASQQNQYISDVNNVVNQFFTQAPFDNIATSFNVYAVKVPSNVSGASYNPNNLIDNYFGSTYWYAGMERLLVATNNSNIYAVANASFPQYDQIFVIVNDTKYGGSGGDVATFSIASAATELALHEAGHSYANLADEYWYIGAENANRTANNNPSTIKWKEFLNQQGVGIYPYESPGNNWYRPHQNCKMRFLGSDFCVVCQNHIEVVTQGLIGGNSSLGTPTGLSNTNLTSTSFKANWNAVSSATSYELQIWTDSWNTVGSTSNLSYDLSGFEAGSTQYWRVRASNGNVSSDYSSYSTVALLSEGGETIPETPINLSSNNVGTTSFTGTWSSIANASSYDIQLWVNDNWATVGSSASNSFQFTGLAASSDQWFRVRAVNSAGSSDYSEYLYVELAESASLTPPTNLHPETLVSYGFYAVWDAVQGATSYEVQTWQNGGWVSENDTADDYLWLYFSSSNGEYWRVRAKNGNSTSDYSGWIHTQLPAAPALDQEEYSLNIYPNPSKDIINIHHAIQGEIHLTLLNVAGQVIMEKQYENDPEILLDISHLATGTYVLQLQSGNQVFIERIAKM